MGKREENMDKYHQARDAQDFTKWLENQKSPMFEYAIAMSLSFPVEKKKQGGSSTYYPKVADLAWKAARDKKVNLVQKRVSSGLYSQFSYLAVRCGQN